MKCPKCKGQKYLEFEHGLIRIRCDICKGKGEINDESIDSRSRQPDSGARIEDSTITVIPVIRKRGRPKCQK